MRILVFGGSFDPPHRGHAALLKAAKKAVRPARTLIVPAWRNPLKAAMPAASAKERLAMIRLALDGEIDRRELDGGKPAFTVETLWSLQKPGRELHFALGWDSACGFAKWKNPGCLRAAAAWWTAKRPGASGKPPSFMKVLRDPMPDVSSTEIRAALMLGDGTPGLAPAVRAYIDQRRLYGLDKVEELRGMLKPSRFEHSRNVGRLAGALARRWGEDEGRALLAGLLHDCGRSVPVPRMARYVREKGLRFPRLADAERHQPVVVHSYISEHLCRKRFGVKDAAVLSAVRKHTLGERRMSRLDKLIYVADACSEDRTYPEAAAFRRLAFDDLDDAYRTCLRQKLVHCRGLSEWIHPLAVRAYEAAR